MAEATVHALRLARISITGSRTGHVGTLVVSQRLPDGRTSNVDGARYYADKYWKPEQYWHWQDRVKRILVDHADDPALVSVHPLS